MAITITLQPPSERLFQQSIEGYREANAAIDAAIEAENWAAINDAQGHRDRHAYAIAMIVTRDVSPLDDRETRT
ncbi:hypothetical protein [Pseudomonas qingdaonensis]|uniref:hypothetical protein n=1 Tax=Pseudomonas qingdaonensis TaxID=2056231 RepID=UPI000C28E035|nr:hypothetical protein [Pseudomonas qingdaonensis]